MLTLVLDSLRPAVSHAHTDSGKYALSLSLAARNVSAAKGTRSVCVLTASYGVLPQSQSSLARDARMKLDTRALQYAARPRVRVLGIDIPCRQSLVVSVPRAELLGRFERERCYALLGNRAAGGVRCAGISHRGGRSWGRGALAEPAGDRRADRPPTQSRPCCGRDWRRRDLSLCALLHDGASI
jgi:hypothetical protein